jgi:uncharacterized membrane protein
MNNNLNNQRFKSDPRKEPITSLLLGISSAITVFLGAFIGGTSNTLLIGILGAILCAILGLIFGIKGLKLSHRNLAIAGIILSLFSLLFSMYMSVIWFMMQY